MLTPRMLLAGPDEPQSRGHPLSYWLEHYTTRATDEDRRLAKEAEAAIREIGTNALPALLVWLRYEPSQTKTDILNFLAPLRRSWFGRWVPAAIIYDHGVPPANVGFVELGPSAAEAIPELEQIANDAAHPRPAARAMIALSVIGPKALPAVEARLSNINFPFPPDAAVNIYLRTRTLLPDHSISNAMARPILMELQTNKNPVLAEGDRQVLKALESPSSWDRRQTKTVAEALSDLRLEREMRRSIPGWKMPSQAMSIRRVHTNPPALASAASLPSAQPRGDEPYPYPLQPSTAAWNDATVEERLKSVVIPKSWRDHATSWQMFRSAITHPYFRGIHVPGYNIADGYSAAREGIVSILSEVDTAPDFGTNVLRWLTELDLAKMASSEGEDWNEPCFMDYVIVCYMAGLDSALETMDIPSRQRLFRLAWDADYFLSRSETMIAAAPIRLMYTIYRKPKGFRGALPRGLVLPPLPTEKSYPLGLDEGVPPANLSPALTAAKAALGLTQRP
jgi:hypothetical protein